MKKTTFKKLALASAIGGLMAANSIAEASQVAYSMYNRYSGNRHRLADLPVDDATALRSSDPGDANYQAPTAWRNASGAVVTSPNYGWTQGGGLPATWWVSVGGNDSASVNSDGFIAARRAGNFLGGPSATGSTAGYAGIQPTALTTGAAAYADADNDTNWGHNADFGLLTVTELSDVTISISGVSAASGLLRGVGSENLIPGFSIWQGWNTNGGTRHTTWDENGYGHADNGTSASLAPGFTSFNALNTGAASPFNPGAQSMTMVGANRPVDDLGTFLGTAWATVANGTATLTLSNLAAGNYYIGLGGVIDSEMGYVAGGLGASTRQYQMSVTSSVAAVPLPAAAWLFGPALAGLGAIGRRKGKAAV